MGIIYYFSVVFTGHEMRETSMLSGFLVECRATQRGGPAFAISKKSPEPGSGLQGGVREGYADHEHVLAAGGWGWPGYPADGKARHAYIGNGIAPVGFHGVRGGPKVLPSRRHVVRTKGESTV